MLAIVASSAFFHEPLLFSSSPESIPDHRLEVEESRVLISVLFGRTYCPKERGQSSGRGSPDTRPSCWHTGDRYITHLPLGRTSNKKKEQWYENFSSCCPHSRRSLTRADQCQQFRNTPSRWPAAARESACGGDGSHWLACRLWTVASETLGHDRRDHRLGPQRARRRSWPLRSAQSPCYHRSGCRDRDLA